MLLVAPVNMPTGNDDEVKTRKELNEQQLDEASRKKELFLNHLDAHGLHESILELTDKTFRKDAETYTSLRPEEKVLILSVMDLYEKKGIIESSEYYPEFQFVKGLIYPQDGSSFTATQMTLIDTGVFMVTTDRLIFAGKKHFDVPITQIINVAYGDNHLMISVRGMYQNKIFDLQKPLIHTIGFHIDGEPLQLNAKDEPLLLYVLIIASIKSSGMKL